MSQYKMRHVFLIGMILFLLASVCLADVPGVDVGEVYRRGNSVEHIDGFQAELDAAMEAMAPPATDADKWFVSVLTAPGCSGCKTLLKEWETNDWLLSIADPNDAKQSWAHFSVYDKSDRSQAFRFTTLKVTTYPTVVVQPPRTGKYGEASTVVYQGVYTGDARKLAEAINSAIRLYVERLADVQGSHQQAPWQPRDDTSDEDEVDEEDSRRPLFPIFDPDREITIPPVDVNFPSIPWMSIIAAIMTGAWPVAAVLGVIAAVKVWRWWRTSRGEKLLLNGKVIDSLLDRLEERFSPKDDAVDEPEIKATTKKKPARRRIATKRKTR